MIEFIVKCLTFDEETFLVTLYRPSEQELIYALQAIKEQMPEIKKFETVHKDTITFKVLP